MTVRGSDGGTNAEGAGTDAEGAGTNGEGAGTDAEGADGEAEGADGVDHMARDRTVVVQSPRIAAAHRTTGFCIDANNKLFGLAPVIFLGQNGRALEGICTVPR